MSDERLRRDERIRPPGRVPGEPDIEKAKMSDERLRRDERIRPPGRVPGEAGY